MVLHKQIFTSKIFLSLSQTYTFGLYGQETSQKDEKGGISS